MSNPRKPTDDPSPTAEFKTDEFDRTVETDATHTHHRRHHRKPDKSSATSGLLRALGLALLCVVLVGVGIFVGLSQRPIEIDNEQHRIAQEQRLQSRQQWLNECGENGHSKWTCNKFDRAHFKTAAELDRFGCDTDDGRNARCHYGLGDAEVVLIIPIGEYIDGEYRTSRRRSRTIINHSDGDDEYYIGVSESGRIEIRKQDLATAIFVINSATGSLHAVLGAGASSIKE